MKTFFFVYKKEIKILSKEQNTGNVHIRGKTVDFIVKTNIGKIEIELNTESDKIIKVRNTVYICDIYSHYTLVGETYNENIKIIQINFSFGLGEKEKPVRTYYLRDENGKKLVENLCIIKYNMDYYLDVWYNKKDKEIIKNNKYLIMLGLDDQGLNTLSNQDKVVSKFMNELNELNKDPEFRIYMTEEEDNRKKMNTYRQEGLEEGLEQGLKQGKKDIVEHMLAKGMSIEEIIEISGLSKEEVEALKV